MLTKRFKLLLQNALHDLFVLRVDSFGLLFLCEVVQALLVRGLAARVKDMWDGR